VAYDWRGGTAWEVGETLELPAADHLYEVRYVVLAPILPNGLALIGEPARFVTLADRRFTALEVGADAIDVTLAGAPGEEVSLLAWDSLSGALLSPVSVVIGADGEARATVSR
jgi:hypothetical protein